jgi:hypothetical protein
MLEAVLGGGTVTSVATGDGITGGTITSSGTISVDLVPAAQVASICLVKAEVKAGTGITKTSSGTELDINGLTTENTIDTSSDNIAFYDSSASVIRKTSIANITSVSVPRGYIDGVILSNNSTDSAHDIDISTGICRDTGNTTSLELTSALTKQIDATWAAGTNNGGMASGVSLSTNTWYHVHLCDLDAGESDIVFDTSITAVNALATPGVGTKYRRIGSVLTDSSSNITAFSQFGNYFYWDTPQLDINEVSSSTAALKTLSTPVGVRTIAILAGQSDGAQLYFEPADITDNGYNPTSGRVNFGTTNVTNLSSGNYTLLTNTSSQIRLDSSTNSRALDIAA